MATKIAQVTNSSTSLTGVDRHVASLAAVQAELGFEVTVVTDAPGYLTQACEQQGIAVAVEPALKPTSRQWPSPAEPVVSRLVELFTGLGTELIHCHFPFAAAQAIPAGNRMPVPCVYTQHVPGAKPLISAWNSGLRFTTISVSKAGLENLRLGGLPESEIYYVPNGTKAMPAGSAPDPERRTGQPNLMFVGSLGLRKGIDIAVLAMYALAQRLGPQCPVLRVYGDGEQEFFTEMAAVLGLGELVQFFGVQPGILERCPSTSVLIVPSRSETGPIVVLEAMSRGIPVVAAEVGEVTEMLPDRRYGRIAPVNSIAAFADAICALLADIATGRFDPALLIERHRSCYTNDQMAQSIAAVYQRVLPA